MQKFNREDFSEIAIEGIFNGKTWVNSSFSQHGVKKVSLVGFKYNESHYQMVINQKQEEWVPFKIRHIGFCRLCESRKEFCDTLQSHAQEIYRIIEPLVRVRLLFS